MKNTASTPIKVMQFVTQLEPGGAQTVAAWIEESLSAENLTISTVFLYYKAPFRRFPSPVYLGLSRPRKVTQILGMIRQVSALLRGSRPDVVILHTHYAIVVVAPLARLFHRCGVVAVHHGPPRRYPRICRLSITLYRCLGFLGEEVYVADSIAPLGSLVIRNPVVKAQATNAPVEMAPSPKVDILTVGRHSTEKDFQTAIAALPFLPAHRTLTLVGNGPETERLRALAGSLGVIDRTYFVGSKHPEAVRMLMREATALVLPSRWEAMPMVLLEGAAEHLGLIVSDIPELRAFVDYGAALPFSLGDPESLARVLARCSQPDVVAALDAGRARLVAAHDPGLLIAQWKEVVIFTVRR